MLNFSRLKMNLSRKESIEQKNKSSTRLLLKHREGQGLLGKRRSKHKKEYSRKNKEKNQKPLLHQGELTSTDKLRSKKKLIDKMYMYLKSKRHNRNSSKN